jgi:hypothetical protein
VSVSEPDDILAWLAALQADFARAIRTPLDASRGVLTARAAAPAGVAPAKGVAAYQRQYWFRLFTAMQGEFPRTARVVGLWRFNQLAQRFLLGHPPRSADLHDVGDGFVAFLDAPPPPPRAPVVHDAVRIDEAWRAVLAAPEVRPWRPRREEASELARVRLRPSPAWRIVDDRFGIVPLSNALVDDRSEAPCALPARPDPCAWAIVRMREGTIEAPLDPVAARLFRALCEAPLADALARVDAACDASQRARLASNVNAWPAQSVAWEMWIDPKDVP